MILRHIWSFSRNPEYAPYSTPSFSLRLKIVCASILWNFIIGIFVVLVVEAIFQGLNIDMGKHKTEDLFNRFSPVQAFFLMVVLAPTIEELIFRGPLVFFKRSSLFPLAFYLSCLVFGLVHLSNFENGSSMIWWAPLLVAPQIIMGFFLGFIRVRLGLIFAILMHMGHNGLLFLLISLIDFK